MLKSFQFFVFITLLTLNSIQQVQAMGILDFFTIHVFSDVTGVVTLNGEPVEGAEIIRTADHAHDKLYKDATVTDENGYFALKDISTFSLRPIMLPTVIDQKIYIKYKGMEYLAWDLLKRTNHIYGELNDKDVPNPKKLELKCELTDDQQKETRVTLEFGDKIITGLCRW
jgi:Domain of unknown function (DUF6795)